jgi:hypothetical protein
MALEAAQHDRRRFARLARRGIIPAGSVEPFVALAASARLARASCGSDALVFEGLVEACGNRPSVESWISGRYKRGS